MSQTEEHKEKQLNVGKVSAQLYYHIDSLFRKFNAKLEDHGQKPIPKKELYVAGLVKYLTSRLDWIEALEETRKQITLEAFLDDLKVVLEHEL